MKNITLGLMAGLGFLCLSHCTNPNPSKKSDKGLLEVDMDNPSANKFENSLTLPSPEEVMTLFEDSGLEFNAKLLNSPENLNTYLTSKSLSYNLGVYVTDAAYLNLFEQYVSMGSYLESIFEITDKLELNGIYQEFDFKKVFMEMDQPDSLIMLSEGVYQAISGYMVETSNEPMLCVISFGSFIELLYLTLESIPEFNEGNEVLHHISDQNMQLESLYEYASQYADNKDVAEMLSLLETMQEVWNSFEYTASETVVGMADDGKLSIGGGMKHTFTEAQFHEIKKVVLEIRTKITT